MREGGKRVREAWQCDGQVHGQRGGQGQMDVHVLQASKGGLAGVLVSAAGEGQAQGRVNSSSPAVLTCELLGDIAPEAVGERTRCDLSVSMAAPSHRGLYMGWHPNRVKSSGAQVGRTAQICTEQFRHKSRKDLDGSE